MGHWVWSFVEQYLYWKNIDTHNYIYLIMKTVLSGKLVVNEIDQMNKYLLENQY